MDRTETLGSAVRTLIRLLAEGKSLEAVERYYDEEVVVFENRSMVRAGRKACLEFERRGLERQAGAPSFKLLRHAVNEESECAFLEYVLRFSTQQGRPMRLEEVAVQRWSRGKIVEERFYFDGIVDEGDDDSDAGER